MDQCESVINESDQGRKARVKVKMIDFANAAFPDDMVKHPGQDQGFLLGLQSLKSILEMLMIVDQQCI